MANLSRAQRKKEVQDEIAKRKAIEKEQKRLLLEKEKKEKKEALEEELRLQNLREEAFVAIKPLAHECAMRALYGPKKPPISEDLKTNLLKHCDSFNRLISSRFNFLSFRCCA
jgi:phage host-nuclease inhibitor protein Gam